MYRGQCVSVVIPCFNEENGIAAVLKTLPEWVDEVIVVDNGSTDGTVDVARSQGATVVVEQAKGYGCAYRTGLPLAKGDIIATLDGDGQYPSAAISPMVDCLLDRDLDFVSGARFPLTNGNSMCRRNVVGNLIQTYAMRLLFRVPVTDSQSGMWVFRRRVLSRLQLVSDGMSFSEEIKLEVVRRRDVRFGEFHIDYQERIGETKLYPWRDGALNMWFLLRRRLGW